MTIRDAAIFGYLQSSRRGVLVQLAGIGDLVMALPAIESLRAGFPHIRWTLATRPENTEVPVGIVEEIRALHWPPTVRNAGLILRETIRLRRERFDVAIHLYGIHSVRGAMGMRALLLGIRPCLSIGRGQPGGRRLFDVSWDEPHGSSSHEVDANLGLLGSLGIPSVAQVPRLVPHNAALQRVAGLAHERFASAEKFVVLFPGGAKPSQHWPVAHYSRLAEWLSRHNLGVCVIGSHVDASDARKIAESAGPKGWNLAGRLTLQEVIALLSLASCYVGNDSGPTHIAAALAVPCVALYRPSQVQKYHPRGSGLIRVLYSELPCSACEQINGRPHTCMEALSFETVRAAVRETVPHILP